MKQELSTKLYKINLTTILKHYLNKEVWKKAWVLYDYDGTVLKLRLSSIDITSNQVTLKVSSNKTYNIRHLWVNIDNNSETAFKKSLFSAMRDVIRYGEEDLSKGTDAFRQAVALDDAVRAENTVVANKILDDEKVTRDDIRKAFITEYENDHEPNYADRYIYSSLYTVIPQQYLMLAYLMEKDSETYALSLIEEVNQTSGKAKDKIAKLVAEIVEELSKYEIVEED